MRCCFILTDRGNRLEKETAGSQHKTHSKHEALPAATLTGSRSEQPHRDGLERQRWGSREAGQEAAARRRRKERTARGQSRAKKFWIKIKSEKQTEDRRERRGSRRTHVEERDERGAEEGARALIKIGKGRR